MNTRSNNLILGIIGTILAVLGIVMVVFVNQWEEVKTKELQIRAINDCMKDGYSVVPGNFSGAVYRICVEDKGYNTNVK